MLAEYNNPPTSAAANLRRLFYWCHTTSRQPFQTGIQRVTRRLAFSLRELGVELVQVGRDDRSGLMEVIGRGPAELDEHLANDDVFDQPVLFIPELTADLIAIGADPILLARAYGLKAAILVHDLIPLKLTTLYSPKLMSAFVQYYDSLANADIVLSSTNDIAAELSSYFTSKNLRMPPIKVAPLPAQFGIYARVKDCGPQRSVKDPLRLACIATWERRKNLVTLLRAVRQAQVYCSTPIHLTLVGKRGLDLSYDAEVNAEILLTKNVEVTGNVSDDEVADVVVASHATIYPSWEEGFGLPLGESLWLGRPCICHNASVMRTLAPGGGTVMIDMLNEVTIAETIVSLVNDPAILNQLSKETTERRLTSWLDYASNVASLLRV